MRPHLFLLLASLASSVVAQDAPAAPPVPAARVAPSAVESPAKPLTESEVRAGFVQMGLAVGTQSPLPAMRGTYELTPAEVDAFLEGLRQAMLGQTGSPADEALARRFDDLLRERVLSKTARLKEANAAFLAKVDADKAVTKTASGLRYQVIKAGDAAAKPKATSTVTCRYHGTLYDGTVFDSTRNRKDEPVTFSLSEVIAGWTEGLQLVGKGGVIHLWVPAALAYGDQEAGPIPAGSVLKFEIEVVEVK